MSLGLYIIIVHAGPLIVKPKGAPPSRLRGDPLDPTRETNRAPQAAYVKCEASPVRLEGCPTRSQIFRYDIYEVLASARRNPQRRKQIQPASMPPSKKQPKCSPSSEVSQKDSPALWNVGESEGF